MSSLIQALQAIPGVRVYLAATLTPIWVFGMIWVRELARRVGH